MEIELQKHLKYNSDTSINDELAGIINDEVLFYWSMVTVNWDETELLNKSVNIGVQLEVSLMQVFSWKITNSHKRKVHKRLKVYGKHETLLLLMKIITFCEVIKVLSDKF